MKQGGEVTAGGEMGKVRGESSEPRMIQKSARARCVCVCVSVCSVADYSPPGSSVHGISQARILEWVAMSASRGSSQPRDRTHVSGVSCTAGGFFTSEPRVPPLGENKLMSNA